MSLINKAAIDSMALMKGRTFPCLNHGFVRLIDFMGDDSAITEAARVSYGGGTRRTREDQALINHLMNVGHTGPFEMCEIKLHIKLPIFVARQWIRTRTASVNELSGRFSILRPEYFTLNPDQLIGRGAKKQKLTEGQCDYAYELLEDVGEDAFVRYNSLLNLGVSREISRVALTLGTYTEWYWKIDLHNLLNFLKQRLDDGSKGGQGAQEEIREYAKIISEIVKVWVPHTWKAFERHQLNAVKLLSWEVEYLRAYLGSGSPVDSDEAQKEIKGLCRKLGIEEFK